MVMKSFLSILAWFGVGVVGIVLRYALIYFVWWEIWYLWWWIAAAIGYVMYLVNGKKESIIIGFLAALVAVITMAVIRLYPVMMQYSYITNLSTMTDDEWTVMYNNDVVEYADIYSGMNFDDYKAEELQNINKSFIDLYSSIHLSWTGSAKFEIIIWFVMIVVSFSVGRGKSDDEEDLQDIDNKEKKKEDAIENPEDIYADKSK